MMMVANFSPAQPAEKGFGAVRIDPVSYTHLDVYKRQRRIINHEDTVLGRSRPVRDPFVPPGSSRTPERINEAHA